MLRPRLVKAEPPLSPERQALAAAIAAHAKAEGELSWLKAAAEIDGPAASAVRRAETMLDRAREMLAEANRLRTETQDAAFREGRVAEEGGSAIRTAREAIKAAEDDLSMARDDRAALRERIPAAEQRVADAAMLVKRLAMDVVRAEFAPTLAALLADFERVRQEFARKAETIEWLWLHRIIASPVETCRPDSPVLNPYKSTLADLMRDAATPLPRLADE